MKTYKSARHVKQALLNGEEVVINRWAALINRQDEVEIWDPKGKGVVASMLHLDKAVKDFYRLAQGIPEKMPKPVTYEKTPSGSGPLGDDTSGDKPWTDPKVNKRPVMQGPTSDPNLKDDTSQDPPWTDPAVNTRPMPDKGRGGLPDTDLGKDTQKNKVKWEDKLTGPEVFRMARDKKMKARKKRAEGELDILKNVSEVIDSGDTFIDMSNDQPIHVGLVYDTGEGFSPNIYAYLMHGWGSEDEALQGAFEWKEEQDTDRLDEEGWAEREKSMEEGFDSMTETYDGLALTVDPEELRKAVKDVKAFNEVQFYWVDDPIVDQAIADLRDGKSVELNSWDDANWALLDYIEESDLKGAVAVEKSGEGDDAITTYSPPKLYDYDTPVKWRYPKDDKEASRRRRSQDMDPGDSGKEEMGTSDPDNEFYPEIEYEPHQIENKGEAPSDLPNDLGGRNNARRRAQQSAVGDFIWEKLSIFDEWWETDAGSHYWGDFENAVNGWIQTIEESVRWAEEGGSGDVTSIDDASYKADIASILYKLGPPKVSKDDFMWELRDIEDQAIDIAWDNVGKKSSRRGFVDTFDKEARPQASYQDMVNASPSRDLLENIADPERWAATQAVKAFSSGYGRGLYKDMDGKRDKANKGMSNMRGNPPGEAEACMDKESVTPPGMEDVVQKLKKDPDVDNPWAVAWSIKDKQKGKKSRRQAGPRLKENWTTDGGYSRDIEAESPEELYHLTKSFGSDEDYDWSSVRPQQQVAEDEAAMPIEARKAVDDKAKSYWSDYFNDYGEDLVKDNSGKKNRKDYEPKVDETPEPAGQQKVKSRRRTRGQAAPAAPPESAPPGGQMTDPETAPQAPPQAPGGQPAPTKPQKAPGAGDEGLKALGWTPDEIKTMSDEDKQKILQVQLKKPGTGASQAPVTPKPPAKPAPEAPQAGPAPMPADPEQGMPAPTARRVERESAEKIKIAKAFQRLAQAAPVQTEQMPPVPQTSPSQPVQPTNQTAPTPAAPGEPAVADEFAGDVSLDDTPETEAMSIYNEILQKEVKAASPEQVPALKSQEFIKRLVTQVGMPITEARQLFGLKSGDGFNKLFQ